MSSVSVVTNALRLRGFRRPVSAAEILHPALGARVREYAYLVGIGFVALGIGAAALTFARGEAHGVTLDRRAADAVRAPVSAAQAGVIGTLVAPALVEPAVPTRLVYQLSDARAGAPLTDIVVSQPSTRAAGAQGVRGLGEGQPLHVVILSRDLHQFQHVHPQPSGAPGEYALDVTFPAEGEYVLFAEFERRDGQTVLLTDRLRAGSPSGSRPAALEEDRVPKSVGGVRVALPGTGNLRSGAEVVLTFRLEDAATGEPLRSVLPYLGAPAQVVIATPDGASFAHVRGEVPDGSAQSGQASHGAAPVALVSPVPPVAPGTSGDHTAAVGYGPEIPFHCRFPAPGLYKVWGQFQIHEGHVITADFVIRIGAA